MDQLKAMQVFVEVAEQGGFAAAARKLNLSTSNTSRYVAGLEEWAGLQLFHRTTRQLSLTNDGNGWLTQCKNILADIDALKNSASDAHSKPGGSLRITAPAYLSKHWISHVITEYIQQNPQVQLDMVITDRNVNLIEEGFDLAIRAGQLQDSSMISRKLGNTRVKLVASPGYIKKRGKPSSPAGLRNHACIIDTIPAYGERWPFDKKGALKNFPGPEVVRVNNGEIARDMAIGGLGFTLLPDFIVDEALQKKQLVSVLEEFLSRDSGIFAIYPSTKHVSANVRSFIDSLLLYKNPLKP